MRMKNRYTDQAYQFHVKKVEPEREKAALQNLIDEACNELAIEIADAGILELIEQSTQAVSQQRPAPSQERIGAVCGFLLFAWASARGKQQTTKEVAIAPNHD